MSWLQMPPGIGTARTASHRALFLQRSETFLAQGRLIAGACSRDPGNSNIDCLRIGLLMGKITSVVNSLGFTGGYAPSIFGVLSNAEAIGATSIEVATAVGTEMVRRIGATGTFKIIGPAAAGGPIQEETVTYTGISAGTITATAITKAFIAGSFVCPTDGSEYPRTFIPDTEGYGIQVTDVDGNSVTAVDMPRFPISGVVDSSQLLPAWPSDTALQAWLVSHLNNADAGQLVFDHNL